MTGFVSLLDFRSCTPCCIEFKKERAPECLLESKKIEKEERTKKRRRKKEKGRGKGRGRYYLLLEGLKAVLGEVREVLHLREGGEGRPAGGTRRESERAVAGAAVDR